VEQFSEALLPELKIVYLPIDDLIPYEKNARTHPDEQIDKLKNSIKKYGFLQSILLNQDNGVIAGHARIIAAKALGLTRLPTVQIGHLNREQQRAYILADNRIALDSGWDPTLVTFELGELDEQGYNLEDTGFSEAEIQAYLNPEILNEGIGDVDAVPAVQPDPISVMGDIWILGGHRLMCGDSTMVDSVASLVNNIKPILMVTDPPYGVKYDPEWRDDAELGVGERSLGKVENDDKVDWTDAYSLFTGSVAYVWHASYFTHIVAANLLACGFEIVSNIIWAKQHFALSRGDYHWQHEPCWYMVRKGKKHNWQGDRKQSTLWDIMNNNSFGNANPEKTWGHGTQKPIDCMLRPIQNNTAPNEYVYDPFGGSGTTLIACEKLGRKCLMMELSPNYCDVIVRRWQEFTGKKAILDSDGSSFESIEHARKASDSIRT
jgi:DNA modification methylase